MSTTPLAQKGVLWTWTVQRFPPKAPPYAGPTDPERFRPFAVGYVELPGQLRIEARLTDCAFDDLRFGLPMVLTTEPLDPTNPASAVTFAFRPDSSGPAQD